MPVIAFKLVYENKPAFFMPEKRYCIPLKPPPPDNTSFLF